MITVLRCTRLVAVNRPVMRRCAWTKRRIPFDPKNMLGGNLNADSDSIEGGSETETLGGSAALASGAS
jgi:hypothetical protein